MEALDEVDRPIAEVQVRIKSCKRAAPDSGWFHANRANTSKSWLWDRQCRFSALRPWPLSFEVAVSHFTFHHQSPYASEIVHDWPLRSLDLFGCVHLWHFLSSLKRMPSHDTTKLSTKSTVQENEARLSLRRVPVSLYLSPCLSLPMRRRQRLREDSPVNNGTPLFISLVFFVVN